MNRKVKNYKTRGFTYCDDVVRNQRANVRNKERRVLRGRSFERNRPLEAPEDEEKVTRKELLKLKYEKWKKEKELRILKNRSATRPPFKCGSVKHDDGELYKNMGNAQKDIQSKTKDQEPLAPAGFVFKAPKGIQPLPYKPLAFPKTPKSKIFQTPQSSKKKNMNKENLGRKLDTGTSQMFRDFGTMNFKPVLHSGVLKSESSKSVKEREEQPERRRTRALTRFEEEHKPVSR